MLYLNKLWASWVNDHNMQGYALIINVLFFLHFYICQSIFHWLLKSLLISGPPSVPSLSCVDLFQNVDDAVNVTVSWTLSGGDRADFYLITITTNAPQTPYGGLLNITASASVTQYELTGFQTDYQYNITLYGVNCLNQEGGESEPLIITPQSKFTSGYLFMHT